MAMSKQDFESLAETLKEVLNSVNDDESYGVLDVIQGITLLFKRKYINFNPLSFLESSGYPMDSKFIEYLRKVEE